MKNPCCNCKTRWLCAAYGGTCWRRRRYFRKVKKVCQMYARENIYKLESYVDETFDELERRMRDGKC